jgi:DNA helicase-2/ATP-dependent DNA helicase PcrA
MVEDRRDFRDDPSYIYETAGGFGKGMRVSHKKFGNGTVIHVDGNKLDIQFDTAGRKRVLDSFVETSE